MTRIDARRLAALPLAAALAVSLAACGVLGGDKGPKTTPSVGNRVPVLSRIESGAQVDPALASVAVVLPPAETNAEWTQPGGNAAKSYGHLALAAAPQRAWTAGIPGSKPSERLAAAPVIGGGQLFVFDTDGAVHAFDAATGRANWRTVLRMEENRSSLFGGGASFADNRVYVTTGLGEVAALDASNGATVWRVKPAGPLRGSPTINFGAIYVMTQDNQVIALNAADGAPLWNESGATAQAGVFGVAAPAAGQGTVIAGYSSGELTAYRYENGRQLWSDALARTSIATSVATLTDIDADPIIDRGRVYALGQGGRMAAYELVTGQRIWELNLAGISTPAVAGEWIFVLTDDARLLCLARATGKVRWIAQLQRYRNAEKE
ncbi:MAG: PQQ-binding-like beta-propeller repeat protein, partial [Novosphingobium sp.]|nr:PQQ-binding-like beta-propeller repeat protein [Novosphingobium sp.]